MNTTEADLSNIIIIKKNTEKEKKYVEIII